MPIDSDRYLFATRLNSFRDRDPDRGATALDLLRTIARVPGLTVVELNYPQHLHGTTEAVLTEVLAETGLTLTALSLRFDGSDFADGAFTSPRAETRTRAIRLAQDAVELAARLGVPHVDLWMAYDGFDYPFQVDYDRLWDDQVDGFRRVAAHDPTIRISVEYKPLEPRRTALIRGMGEALLAARDVGLPNFGVQIDFCQADDGLLVGSVHLWQTLELLATLRRYDYHGTVYFDPFPVREDPAAES